MLHAFLNHALPSEWRPYLLDNLGPFWLQCKLKVSLAVPRRGIMGSTQYKSLTGFVVSPNACFHLQVAQKVNISGLVRDFGSESNTHLYIQSLKVTQ